MIESVLLSIPGPTKNWAEIVGHLAWPLFALIVVLRFQTQLGQLIGVLAERFKSDNIRMGSLEVTKSTDIYTLDKAAQDTELGSFEADDIDNVEKLFELIADEDGFVALSKWVTDYFGPAMDIDNFLTLPKYASARAEALAALFPEERL